MMKYLTNGVPCVATLAVLLFSTPEAQAQPRGGGRGPAVRYYSGPAYNTWYGQPSWYSGSSPYWSSYGYSPYRSFYYHDSYYPRTYYYPETYYQSYPTTTYESNYTPVETASKATINVRVPDPNAQVWFNGVATQQRGTDRRFETPALSGGYRHTYEVRARWMGANGQMMDRTRTIDVQPGQDLVVDFG